MIDEEKVPVQEEFVPLPYDGTFESAKRCHQHLWNYLARTGCNKPSTLFGIKNSCYACQYAAEMVYNEVLSKDFPASVKTRIEFRGCDFCPIKWEYRGEAFCPCCAEGTPYCEWDDTFLGVPLAGEVSARKRYATQVRDMEFEDTRELLLQKVKELVKEEEEAVPLFLCFDM